MSSEIQTETKPHNRQTQGRGFMAVLSLGLATLTMVSLLFALASWVQNGLASALNHRANGAATLLLLLLWINEKYSPQPWIDRNLRVQTRQLATAWAESIYTVIAGVTLILIAIAFYRA